MINPTLHPIELERIASRRLHKRIKPWKWWLFWLATAIALVFCLIGCSQDIAGLSRNKRLTFYGAALTFAGQPELGAVAYGLRRPVTSAKNPVRIQP